MTSPTLHKERQRNGKSRLGSEPISLTAEEETDIEWRAMCPYERAEVLRGVSDHLLSEVDERTGRLPHRVRDAASIFHSFAAGTELDERSTLSVHSDSVDACCSVPIGVVGLVCGPGTDAVTLARHCAAALAAGNELLVSAPAGSLKADGATLLRVLGEELSPTTFRLHTSSDALDDSVADAIVTLEAETVPPGLDWRFSYAQSEHARSDRRVLLDAYSRWYSVRASA